MGVYRHATPATRRQEDIKKPPIYFPLTSPLRTSCNITVMLSSVKISGMCDPATGCKHIPPARLPPQVFWGDMLDELTRTVQMHASAGDIIVSQVAQHPRPSSCPPRRHGVLSPEALSRSGGSTRIHGGFCIHGGSIWRPPIPSLEPSL